MSMEHRPDREPNQPGSHRHHSHGSHAHVHGVLDPVIATTARGIRALEWSFAGLLATALFQVVIVALTGSIALLADTIHNFADAATAIPLWIAFACAPSRSRSWESSGSQPGPSSPGCSTASIRRCWTRRSMPPATCPA